MTIKDANPLPRIDEIFTSLHKAYCFLALDLLIGYHQMHVREEDRPKTAFFTHKGLYVFTVIPFGLCNARATFQRLMDCIFRDQIGKDLAAYVDDLLMYELRHAEILTILDRTLGQLIDAGWKCKPSKCQAFPDSIQYLGHIINDGKIASDRSRLDKIREWPFGKRSNDMASFLGLCNYYRRLIPHFAEYDEPLYKQVLELKVTASEVLEKAFLKVKDEV